MRLGLTAPRYGARMPMYRCVEARVLVGSSVTMPSVPQPRSKRTISQITRRDIIDWMTVQKVSWWGRLDETAFLGRLYNLDELPSHDHRFSNASGDIWQHRINNWDWEDDWVFDDERFGVRNGTDEQFLAFLAEMVHPVVRAEEEVAPIVEALNGFLRRDGWELAVVDAISGRPVYAGRKAGGLKSPAGALSMERYKRVSQPDAIRDHLRRIHDGLERDPPAAIASAKELVETTCKVILDDYGIEYSRRDEVMDLYKKLAKGLKLRAEDIPASSRGSEAAQQALRSLVSVVQSMAELRNELGLGHGRAGPHPGSVRHSRLAFNAATAVVEFLLDTWHERPPPHGGDRLG